MHMPDERRLEEVNRKATPFVSGDITRAQRRAARSKMNTLERKLARLKIKGERLAGLVEKATAHAVS